MKVKMKKLLFLVLFLIPFGLYCFTFQIPFSNDSDDWSAFGSYMSGIYGSLAFILLAYTTWITQKQFKTQNEDNTFFKLHDALQNRIENSSVKIDGDSVNGHSTPEYLVKDFSKKLTLAARRVARNVLCKDPEMIIDASYHKIFEAALGLKSFENFTKNKSELISGINNAGDFNHRWDYVKNLIGSQGYEDPKIAEALESTGRVLFYKISFDTRKFYYENVLNEMLNEHGAFLDVYFKNISFLVAYVETCTEKEIYYKYINSQLSKYELILLFYFIAGSKSIERTHSLIHKFLLHKDFDIDCSILMIDSPNPDQIKSDLAKSLKN